VIPHTRTLLFSGNMAVRVIGHPSGVEIGFDVLRSMLVGLAINAAQLACLLLPYASLVRAYAPARRAAAQRAIYYRFWLLPAALLPKTPALINLTASRRDSIAVMLLLLASVAVALPTKPVAARRIASCGGAALGQEQKPGPNGSPTAPVSSRAAAPECETIRWSA